MTLANTDLEAVDAVLQDVETLHLDLSMGHTVDIEEVKERVADLYAAIQFLRTDKMMRSLK
jgi:Tfp pilus assembly pilus retraction ATPase PilT